MNISPVWIASAFLLSFLSTACSSAQTTESAKSGNDTEIAEPADNEVTATLSCDSNHDEIVDLLHSGLPTYDYQATADLPALAESVDVVLSG